MAKKNGADSLPGVGSGHDQNADASYGESPVKNRRRERGDEPDDGSVHDRDENGVVRGEGLDPVDLGRARAGSRGWPSSVRSSEIAFASSRAASRISNPA